MKTLRIAALGAALVLGVTATAHAQQPATSRPDRAVAGQRGQHRPGQFAARRLMQGIQLTDAQKAQVQSIHQKYAEQQRTLFAQLRGNTTTRPDSATRARLRTESRSLMDRQVAEVRGVLSADQQKTFDENVATVRERMAKRDAHFAKQEAKADKRALKAARKR